MRSWIWIGLTNGKTIKVKQTEDIFTWMSLIQPSVTCQRDWSRPPPPLNWAQLEEKKGQDKGVLQRYWNHSQRESPPWGPIFRKRALHLPSSACHGRWPVIRPRISVLVKNRNYFPEKRGHLEEKLPSHRQEKVWCLASLTSWHGLLSALGPPSKCVPWWGSTWWGQEVGMEDVKQETNLWPTKYQL